MRKKKFESNFEKNPKYILSVCVCVSDYFISIQTIPMNFSSYKNYVSLAVHLAPVFKFKDETIKENNEHTIEIKELQFFF